MGAANSPLPLDEFRPELVVAFIGPVGSDLPGIIGATGAVLAEIGYENCPTIKLTSQFPWLLPDRQIPERAAVGIDEWYERNMAAGDEIRRSVGENGAAVLCVLRGVLQERARLTGIQTGLAPSPNTAYLVDSLKTPEEVSLLRAIYGPWLVVVACHCPRNKRITNLKSRIMITERNEATAEATATTLVERDEQGEAAQPFGQNVRDAFALADLVVEASTPGSTEEAEFTAPRRALKRFFNLLFQRTIHTPTRDEQGMFFAFAASLRSASLSRQVGTAICTKDGQVIAVGTNETPKSGGGAYWADSPEELEADRRTFRLRDDPARIMRKELLRSVFGRLAETGFSYAAEFINVSARVDEFEQWQADREAQGAGGRTLLDDTIEYHREVHAELSALTDTARRGASVQGQILYTTTFPCHDCAKHIVAAGIERVVFLDPYPKSLVRRHYADSIHVEGDSDGTGDLPRRVAFENFVGVSPRRYSSLFHAPGGLESRHDRSNIQQLRLADYGDRYAVMPTSWLTFSAMANELLVYQWLRARISAVGTELAFLPGLRHDGDRVTRDSLAGLEICDYDGNRFGIGQVQSHAGSYQDEADHSPEPSLAPGGEVRARSLATLAEVQAESSRAVETAAALWDACQNLDIEPPSILEFGELLEQRLERAARSLPLLTKAWVRHTLVEQRERSRGDEQGTLL